MIICLADELKLKVKPASKPVRLFTDEELKRYDGSEVEDFRRKTLYISKSKSFS